MGRTFIRQDTQVRKSDVYDDSVAPSLANYETNPVVLEDDLNSVRSQLQNILNRNGASMPSGNWYDDISTPVTFENGAERGVSILNQDLHDLQRKRVLVSVSNLSDITVPSEVLATGTLTGSINFGNGNTVTIDTKVYTFQTTLTNVDGNIQLGGSLAATLQNLYDAINLTGTPGSQYAAAMTLHPTVAATAVGATTVDVEAKLGGTQGNLIATTSSVGDPAWGAATLTGGAGDAVVLLIGELPSNTTAAIGSVATRGTVAAYNASFGNISLATVSGSNVLDPKNLCMLEDSTTHDPILSGGRVVYGLFQTESNTDGSTMTGTTPNRAQLSFVRINVGGTALEDVPSVDIAGKVIHYSSVERKALEDLNEQDFLRGAVVDTPAAATITRQITYDNQGIVPVEVTTNAILDLNAAGIYWRIRDLANANLFTITEGSTGGTTTLQFGTDVDTFDNNAVVNDFVAGVTIRSGGARPITVGVTDGVINTTAGDLKLTGAAQLAFSDQWQSGSTYGTDLVLADTSAEWSLFETNFGEVSLLNAINKAYSHGSRGAKVYASVTANVTAGTDVGGVGGGANLDTQLPDMSGGTFLTAYDVYVNGELMRPAAGVGVNDYYPGTSLANGQLKFDFKLHTNDVICVIPYSA